MFVNTGPFFVFLRFPTIVATFVVHVFWAKNFEAVVPGKSLGTKI